MALHRGQVVIDDSRWPLVLITQVVPTLTDAARVSSLAETDAIIESHSGCYAIVLDNRVATPLSPTQRALLADYGRRTASRVKLRCAGTAMIVSTELMRMMVTAIHWQVGKMSETQMFDELDAGIRWATERLAQAATGLG